MGLALACALVAAACGSSADTESADTGSVDAGSAETIESVATTEPVVAPAPTEPAPAEPAPAPTEPAPAEPAPAEPAPAPTEPAPAEPAPAEPAPAPTEPAPTEPAPAESEPADNASAAEPLVAAGQSCADIAASFVTSGSANADLPDPQVAATCSGDAVVVTSNQIPDFPYIETSPGLPDAFDLEFTIPAAAMADAVSSIPAIGPIGVALNGVPIYGATEGTGGDVMSLSGGFTECGGHNGPTGYHFHTFDVTGSDDCMFSQAQASAAPVLFGYSLDGFPIYGGNFFYTSSWQLTDASLFASDTFSAHSYVAGSGDLDQCNGRTDENGNYAYYTTDGFPYTLGCYSGVAQASAAGGQAGAPPGGDGGPPPPGDEDGEGGGGPGGEGGGPGGPPDFSEAAATLGVTVEALEAALGQPPFDFDAAAATLGVTAEALEAALPAPPGR